ncbi:unnamed protein product [Heterotrigona itama]|uniref:J domain-containing protein n=1 Tax=Heterotrigona itama TaxID=395501 RepID=A0A6V7H864_9HYME|nr:unnamed protein product [Heterotrigona itama]
MTSLMNYYDVLGCTRESTAEDVKRAYRALALKFHPDKNTSESDSANLQRVLEAWHTLRDPKSRREYDAVQRQEELDLENVPIYAKISIDEMKETDGNGDTLAYPCRCGGSYRIEKRYTWEKNQSIHVPCLECTFLVVIET